MKKNNENIKPRVGIFFLGCNRFKPLGEGTESGSYHERTKRAAKEIQTVFSQKVCCIDPGIIYDEADMQRALEFFRKEKADCVLCSFMSWTEDEVWIRFLRDSGEFPLIYYYPSKKKIPYKNCDDTDDFIEFLSSGGLVGALIGSGSIPKMVREAEIIVGTPEKVLPKISVFADACRIRSKLKSVRIGLMAAYNEVMWNTYLHPFEIIKHGPGITFISYQELLEISDSISETEVREELERLSRKYKVDPGIDDVKFAASVRYSLGMKLVMNLYDLDVLSLNDVDMRIFKTIGLRPGFYPPALRKEGAVICPEGDLGAAYIAYVLKLFSGKQVNFIEPFYINEATGTFTAGHAGPNDYNYPESENLVRISIDTRFAQTKYKYAGAPFAWLRIPPAQMTMVHLSECNGNYKMVTTLVESLPGEHIINGYSHSEFRPLTKTIDQFFEEILSIGTTQHFLVTPGDFRSGLNHFARIMKFNYFEV